MRGWLRGLSVNRVLRELLLTILILRGKARRCRDSHRRLHCLSPIVHRSRAIRVLEEEVFGCVPILSHFDAAHADRLQVVGRVWSIAIVVTRC